MKGHYIRSRVQWLHEGERPTKYFCSLEHQNFITKTIKKVKTKDGTIITDQKDILAEVKSFYSQLFQNQDNKINEVDLKDLLKGIETRKLTGLQAKALEGELKLEELTKTLKNMQDNKTPGIDGFPAEFFKVFWTKLGKIKKGKSRENICNWRPLSMLTVIYKIASGAIANRIKTVLNSLISHNQNGFVPGRYIGESTRLIYDIMHFTEFT